MEVHLTTHPSIISLYSGAGGLDYGFHAAGFRTALATDIDKDACNTLRSNNFSTVVESDIHNLSSNDLLNQSGLQKGDVEVLVGGPPCQPFSKSGYWIQGDSNRLSDPRSQTLESYLRVLSDVQPRVFLLENVEGLGYVGKSEGLQLVLNRIEEINLHTGSNYRPQAAVLRATDFGVPQARTRFFLVGARDGSVFKFPEPEHYAPDDPLKREPFRTAWDAISDLEPTEDEDLTMRGKWADLLPSIPEGENYLYHTPQGAGLPLFGWRTRYWSFLLKLAKDRPSWTIQAQPGPSTGPFHWENRRLSTRELCRLQTFPDHVTILGGRTAVQRQVGNAVPSLLAEILARQIGVQLLGLELMNRPPLLKPVRKPSPPPPKSPSPVPQSFRALLGNHAPHPGIGRGPNAKERGVDKQLGL